MSPDIVASHRIGDSRCTNLSFRDKQDLRSATTVRNNTLAIEEQDEYDSLAQEYGYNQEEVQYENPNCQDDSYLSIA